MNQTAYMKPKTKFGRWLLNEMINNEFTCTDVAKRLRTTRQNVRNHIIGVSNPSFAYVIAYCWLFNTIEYLDDIWILTMEEES